MERTFQGEQQVRSGRHKRMNPSRSLFMHVLLALPYAVAIGCAVAILPYVSKSLFGPRNGAIIGLVATFALLVAFQAGRTVLSTSSRQRAELTIRDIAVSALAKVAAIFAIATGFIALECALGDTGIVILAVCVLLVATVWSLRSRRENRNVSQRIDSDGNPEGSISRRR